MRSAAGALALLVAAGCRGEPRLPLAVPAGPLPPGSEVSRWSEPRREARRELGPGGRPTLVREVLVMPDGAVVPHGRDAVWYASGRLKHDRFFLEGEPAGLWRSWYEDGTPRSAVHCGAEPATTRWWHPNGRPSSRGPTVRAVKEGTWTFWHANGRLAEQGEYRGGRREGVWTFWNADGRMTARGVYRDDLRVGEWEVWDEDGTPGLRVPPPPPGER